MFVVRSLLVLALAALLGTAACSDDDPVAPDVYEPGFEGEFLSLSAIESVPADGTLPPAVDFHRFVITRDSANATLSVIDLDRGEFLFSIPALVQQPASDTELVFDQTDEGDSLEVVYDGTLNLAPGENRITGTLRITTVISVGPADSVENDEQIEVHAFRERAPAFDFTGTWTGTLDSNVDGTLESTSTSVALEQDGDRLRIEIPAEDGEVFWGEVVGEMGYSRTVVDSTDAGLEIDPYVEEHHFLVYTRDDGSLAGVWSEEREETDTGEESLRYSEIELTRADR